MTDRKTTTPAKLRNAINAMIDFYYEPSQVQFYNRQTRRREAAEVNAFEFQAKQTLYRLLVQQNFLLNANAKYRQSIQDELNGKGRSNGGTNAEIPAQVLRSITEKAQRCQQQQTEVEAFIEVAMSIWQERYPDEAFEMPKAQTGGAIQISEADHAEDLKALEAMGFSVGSVREEKTADQRGELEGVTDR